MRLSQKGTVITTIPAGTTAGYSDTIHFSLMQYAKSVILKSVYISHSTIGQGGADIELSSLTFEVAAYFANNMMVPSFVVSSDAGAALTKESTLNVDEHKPLVFTANDNLISPGETPKIIVELSMRKSTAGVTTVDRDVRITVVIEVETID